MKQDEQLKAMVNRCEDILINYDIMFGELPEEDVSQFAKGMNMAAQIILYAGKNPATQLQGNEPCNEKT